MRGLISQVFNGPLWKQDDTNNIQEKSISNLSKEIVSVYSRFQEIPDWVCTRHFNYFIITDATDLCVLILLV